jgi:hypothetical protein
MSCIVPFFVCIFVIQCSWFKMVFRNYTNKMKTIGYKLKITVSIFAMILLTSCSVKVPAYSVFEPVFFKYLLPAITKTATKYAEEKLESTLNKKISSQEEKKADQAKEKPATKDKQKITLFSFGTTEAYLASTDNEESKAGGTGS